MDTLKTITVVFCAACIGSELVTQLTGDGWARRCIKAVAGLYILVVLLRAVPQWKADLQAFSVPEASPVQVGTLEETIQAEYAARTEQAEPEGGEPPA